ncbi:Protein of unknown function [Pyronema omphalodes CBS 100304]|uniref:Uncharacterized protein n=1 Tax=Pyronema omphalodes (strain CBS 100304) TaxID=1076935 RepID=U4L573_PYROM|nr:Protein of unknown function [Pyronema omphalodes CBS 100304]
MRKYKFKEGSNFKYVKLEDGEKALDERSILLGGGEGPQVSGEINAYARERYTRVENMRGRIRKKRRPRGIHQDPVYAMGSSGGRLIRRRGMEIVRVENTRKLNSEERQPPDARIHEALEYGEGSFDGRLIRRPEMEIVRVEDTRALNGEKQQPPDIVIPGDLQYGDHSSEGHLIRNSEGEIEGRVIMNDGGEIGLEV